MRPHTARAVLIAFLAVAASPLLADSPERCLDLRASKDEATMVAPGIQVVVTARNSCTEDFPGSQVRFKVTVRSRGGGGGVAGTHNGRFQGTIAAGGSAETKVFVECDPERAGAVEVELLK